MKKYWMSKIQWLRYKARAESLNRLICNWFIVRKIIAHMEERED